MRLEKIFRKSRKTEPKAIVMCRNITMIIIIALFIGYTVYLIINICNDVPILRIESRADNSLRLPTIIFEFDYKVLLECSFSYNNDNATDAQNCLKYISQPTYDSSSKKYKGSFNPSPDLVLEGQDQPHGMSLLGIGYGVIDPAFNNSKLNMIEASIKYTDNSYDQLIRTIKNSDAEFYNSLVVSSAYVLFYGQVYVMSYTQNERHIMKKNSLSAFGIQSGTLRVPYITAELDNGPMPNIFNGGLMVIKPQTFAVKVEVEQRYGKR